MNTDTPHHSGSRVQSTSWVIDARWYYAFLGYALGVIIPDRTSTQYPIAILSVAFLLVLASNVYFSRYLRQHGEAITDKQLDILNRSQVAIDLVFFFVAMLLTSGGVGNAGHSFFFIPIVISMILFGFQGAIIVAVVSGILVFLSVLVHFQVFNMFLMHETFVMSSPLFLALAHAAIIFLLYLLIGFFEFLFYFDVSGENDCSFTDLHKINESVCG